MTALQVITVSTHLHTTHLHKKLVENLRDAVAIEDYPRATAIQMELNEHLEQLRSDPRWLPANLLRAALSDAIDRDDYKAAVDIQVEIAQACELSDAPEIALRAIFQEPARTKLMTLRGGVTLRRVAIVTGGTRGIGRGIAEALAESKHDLLLTFNSDYKSAEATAAELRTAHAIHVVCVGGDISVESTRDAVFKRLDEDFPENTHELGAVVHNAGQYVGITSSNADGLDPKKHGVLGFGDGSMLNEGGHMQLDVMKYYQRLYGDAYVDLCERGLVRMGAAGGSLIGISSPGCTLQYNANAGYDLPGSGKCVMEYAMRLIALRCAAKNVNCNVVVPGVTETDAWAKLAASRGADREELVAGIASRLSLMGTMTPRQLGDAVAFLCSPQGRIITGVSLPVDGGVHLKA